MNALHQPTLAGAWRRARVMVATDLTAFDRLPGGRIVPVAAVAAVLLTFSVLRLGYGDVFVESLPFLGAILVLGVLSRTTGMALAGGHALIDLVRAIVVPDANFSTGITWSTALGRVAVFLLLWTLAVTIPGLARQARATLAAPTRSVWIRLTAVPASALLAGALVTLWAGAEPYLVRPIFLYQPTYQATLPQRMQLELGMLAALITAVIGYAVHRRLRSPADDMRLLMLGSLQGTPALIARAAAYALVTVALLGLLTSPIDLVILAGGFAGGEALARLLRGADGVSRMLLATPRLVRLVAAVGVALVVGQLVGGMLVPGPGLGSEFLPLVVGIAATFALLRPIVQPEADRSERGSEPSAWIRAGAVVALALTGSVVGVLADVAPAFADDCSGWRDCLSGAWAWFAGAVAAGAAFLWSVITAIFDKTPRVIGDLAPLASEEGARAAEGLLSSLQADVARDALINGDNDEYYRIRDLSREEFVNEAMTGKWDKPNNPVSQGIVTGGYAG